MWRATSGTQITTYYQDGNREPIPFDLQAGISRRLEHAPLVFSVNHATPEPLGFGQPEIRFRITRIIINIYEREEGFGKQFMRHVVFGVELLPSDNFIIRAGYNYQRRQELKYDEKLSTVGMSLGFGVKIKRFRLDFATSRFHLAGSSNLFSLCFQFK